MKTILSTILLCAILLSGGCRSIRGKSDWYSGPEEYRGATEHAINNALAELPREVGRPLKWDWSRNRVALNVIEPTHYVRGIPQLTRSDGLKAGGWANSSGRITVPRGFRMGTIRHEAGHVVLFANGFPDGNQHHQFPYFSRHTYQTH